MAIKPWKRLRIKETFDHFIFKIHHVLRQDPRDGSEHTFIELDTKDWVNVVAITKSGNLILVEEFRHGINEVIKQLPSGLMEDGEDPIEAAARELVEETGYASRGPGSILGSSHPNAAFQSNKIHSVLFTDCERISDQNLDRNEDIEVYLEPQENILQLIEEGTIKTALGIQALLRYWVTR